MPSRQRVAGGAAAGMHLDGDAVADLGLVYGGPSLTTVPMYSWPGVKSC